MMPIDRGERSTVSTNHRLAIVVMVSAGLLSCGTSPSIGSGWAGRTACVTFPMSATVGCSGPAATHRRVTFYVSPNLIEWFWNQILRYTFFVGTNAPSSA
jgi:hypothetical protein